jgi:hypothetical protein
MKEYNLPDTLEHYLELINSKLKIFCEDNNCYPSVMDFRINEKLGISNIEIIFKRRKKNE